MKYNLLVIFVIVILVILFLVSLIEIIPARRGEPARLSIGLRRAQPTLPCSGDLTVTSQLTETGNCKFQADVVMRNCEGKRFYVFEGSSCSGIYICTKEIEEPESRWRCVWEYPRASYTFTLCADDAAKDSTIVSC
ncbi:MAG: hypothetical protein QMD36_03880 [Candidatus Aenigmarchaeota archaeon]|nr:hypothetical protein [Candidatus Aenigmarchaeota archaeon]